MILAGLLGAIFWYIVTWYYWLPISSSHALMGGYAGAAIAKAGWGVILLEGWTKTLIFIILSPAIGFVLGSGLMLAVYWIFRNWAPQRLDKYFRKLQLISAAAYTVRESRGSTVKPRKVMPFFSTTPLSFSIQVLPPIAP